MAVEDTDAQIKSIQKTFSWKHVSGALLSPKFFMQLNQHKHL